MSEDLRLRAARALLETLPLIMRNIGASMRSSGGDVTPHQHRLLTMIAARPRTLSQLADIQGVTPATATTLITTLEGRGWVRREHDALDRRCVVVTLTDAGRQHLAAAQDVAEKGMAEALASLSDADLERLLGGLEVLDELRSHPGRQPGAPANDSPHAPTNGPATT